MNKKKVGFQKVKSTRCRKRRLIGLNSCELRKFSRMLAVHKKEIRALREAKERYGQIFFHSPAVQLVIAPETGEIVVANLAAERFYGYSIRELTGMSIYQFNQASPEKTYKDMQQVQEEGRVFLFQHKLRNGMVRAVEVYAGQVTVGQKKLIHSVVMDVTLRQQTEAELERTRKGLGIALESIKAGIWDVDLITGDFYVDERWKELVGYQGCDKGMSIVECWRQRLHPEDSVRVEEAVKAYIAGYNDKYEVEYRLRDKNSTYRWILAIGKLTKNKDGQPIRFTGASIDITDRRQIEHKLSFAYELRRRSDFINDKINGKNMGDEQGAALMETWNVKLFLPFFCCLIKPKKDRSNTSRSDSRNMALRELKFGVLDALVDRSDCLVWECPDGIGVLFQAGEESGWKYVNSTVISLQAAIALRLAEIDFYIGVSGIHTGMNALQNSYREARSAALFRQCEKLGGGISLFRDLGIFQLLADFQNQAQIGEFIEQKIGKLVKYDQDRGTELLLTLEELLQGANLKQVADKLFLHHKTMVFRKQRIESILGISIESFEVKMALAVAVKLYRLQRLGQ